MTIEWFIQGSAAKPYHIIRHPDEHLSCSCPAWTSGWKRSKGYRTCKHVESVASDEGFALTRRGEYVFVGGTAPSNKAKKVKAALGGPAKSWADKAAARAARVPITVAEVEQAAATADAGFIEPMLASKMPDGKTVASYPADKFIMEEKYDGHRMIIRIQGGKVRAWSRLGNRRTLPVHIEGQLQEIEIDVVLDGELIVPGGKSYSVTDGANTGLETLVLFDVIEAMGKKVGYAQAERRQMLEIVYGAIKGKMVVLSKQMPPSQKAVDEIWARGGEGAIIKSLDGMYRPNVRTPDWVKLKKSESAVITVTGWEDGKSGPYSVTVGTDAKGNVIKVKTLDTRELDAFANILPRPTKMHPDLGRRLVVTMQERTPDGKARHAMWDHWCGPDES